MKAVYPDQGLGLMLSLVLSVTVKMKLFTNNYTPTRVSTTVDFTVAAWTGYADAAIASGDWTNMGVVGHIESLTAPDQAFLNSSGAPVDAYGYYITDNDGTVVLQAVRFDSAPVSKADGESFVCSPKFGLASKETSA